MNTADTCPLTVGSLFSGIGGLDLGLERAGMQVIWQSEIDPYCCKVLAKHWPHIPNLGDVTKINWSTVERPDVICGGYPCPPFSSAGLRRGEADERYLWPFMLDAIRALRPDGVVVENVTGHLVLGFGRILGDLAESGYDTQWDCIPAAAFGAPHRRDRVYLVAYPHRGGLRLESEPIFGRHHKAIPVADGTQRTVADTAGDDGPRQGAPLNGAKPAEQRQPRGSGGRGILGEWLPEPSVDRVAHGSPRRLVRPQLEALGNAVVPQVAEYVGRQLARACGVWRVAGTEDQ